MLRDLSIVRFARQRRGPLPRLSCCHVEKSVKYNYYHTRSTKYGVLPETYCLQVAFHGSPLSISSFHHFTYSNTLFPYVVALQFAVLSFSTSLPIPTHDFSPFFVLSLNRNHPVALSVRQGRRSRFHGGYHAIVFL